MFLTENGVKDNSAFCEIGRLFLRKCASEIVANAQINDQIILLCNLWHS